MKNRRINFTLIFLLLLLISCGPSSQEAGASNNESIENESTTNESVEDLIQIVDLTAGIFDKVVLL